MDQGKNTPGTPREAAEAAGALRFISAVMARTQERLGDFAAIGVWWGTVSFLVLATHLLICYFGYATTARLTALWIAHNVIGWSATFVIVGRARGMSPTVRQECGVWAATNLVLWILVYATVWAEAVPGRVFWTMLQLSIGFALVCANIIAKEKLAIAGGLLLVGLVPLALAFPRWSTLISVLLIGAVYAFLTLFAWMGWRRERRAA